MPATFTGPFAKAPGQRMQISVSEAVNGDKFKNGHAYVCPGGKHIGVRMRGPLPEVAVTDEPRDALYKPTVNVLMETAGRCLGRRTMGSMLTGMGSDGCEGARILKEKVAASLPRMRHPAWSTACPRPWWTPDSPI